MSDEKLTFTAGEFADYWESYAEDGELAIDFMANRVVDDEGRQLLSETVTTLAHRHGVSSDKVKSFRAALRKACQKAGIEDIYSPKKVKVDDETGYAMVLRPSKPHAKPAIANASVLVEKRMKKWLDKGECTISDLHNALDRLSGSSF